MKASALCFFCFTDMFAFVMNFVVPSKSASLPPWAAKASCWCDFEGCEGLSLVLVLSHCYDCSCGGLLIHWSLQACFQELPEQPRNSADVILMAMKASVLCFSCFTDMIALVMDFVFPLKSASLPPRAAKASCWCDFEGCEGLSLVLLLFHRYDCSCNGFCWFHWSLQACF